MDSVTVVIPIYNELDNVPLLYEQLTPVLASTRREYEILFVDDGSRDGSTEALDRLAEADDRVKVVHFRKNYGQTAAMAAGFQYARGDVIVTMDGDLQNDPSDIPAMLEKLQEGYDLVHGWRKKRQDAFLNRRLPSMIANRLISWFTGFPVRDLGCTLKAMRSDFAHELQLYGEMHRFIPILAHWHGARCVEVETNHHPRVHGTTKYGISRTSRVILDLITVKFLTQYSARPMQLFGLFAIACAGISALSGFATIVMWLGYQIDMTGNPLLLLTTFAFMAGIQFLSLGMLGEVSIRTYYESQEKQPYHVRRLVNFADASNPAVLPASRAA